MHLGGAERSLIGLLDAFDYEAYEVSLFLYRHEGELLDLIPDQVRVLPQNDRYTHFDTPIVRELFSRHFLFGLSRLFAKIGVFAQRILFRKELDVWATMQATSRSLQWLLPKLEGDYDLAISFLGIPDVLLNRVSARKKAAWNHTDYTRLRPFKAYDRALYRQLDWIVSVSENCTAQFLSVYPEFQEKAITIENILSSRLLTDSLGNEIPEWPGASSWKLLSIGRFSEAKNFDNVPAICRMIREQGPDANWYLIGYGGDEPLIRQKIREYRMDGHVFLLGKKNNPYPYIKACDVYVQPSRYEGKSVAVREAQILGKPVVITAYETSGSQLEDGFDGLIVPMDNRGCAEGIVRLLRDPQKMREVAEHTGARDYTNAEEIEKLYRMMEQE